MMGGEPRQERQGQKEGETETKEAGETEGAKIEMGKNSRIAKRKQE